MTQNGTLSAKQNKTIGILLSSPNITQACEIAGIGRSTLCRWMKMPAFSAALAEAEGVLLQDASRAFLNGQTAALETIRSIMTSGATDMVRLRAAESWLANLFKYRELNALENRVSKLEERLNVNDQKSN